VLDAERSWSELREVRHATPRAMAGGLLLERVRDRRRVMTMSNIKHKFAILRLERRLKQAEMLAGHPRKGSYWQREADDLRRRLKVLREKHSTSTKGSR